MNMIRAGGAALTAGSEVSSVASAVLVLCSLLPQVHSGMFLKHLQCSEAPQASSALQDAQQVSAALWGLSGIFAVCALECSSGVFVFIC